MASAKHTRSIHIDAPVEKVFHYLEDPAHFIGAMPEESHGTPPTVGAVHRTPEGVVTTYECKYRELGMHMTAVFTREEYVVNERIVDRSSTGPIWTWTVEPDGTGTTLTLAYEHSSKIPLVGQGLDKVMWNGDKDLETMLAADKEAVEA